MPSKLVSSVSGLAGMLALRMSLERYLSTEAGNNLSLFSETATFEANSGRPCKRLVSEESKRVAKRYFESKLHFVFWLFNAIYHN